MESRRFIGILSLINLTIVVTLLLFGPIPVLASGDSLYHEEYIKISTFDDRPISLDRILYMAFRDIGYQTTLINGNVEAGLDAANRGETDGVVTFTPNMEEGYPNLRRVSVPIEQTDLVAFVREDGNLDVKEWNDLSGLRVGVLTHRPYINGNIPKNARVTYKEDNGDAFEGLLGDEYDVLILTRRSHETIQIPGGVKEAGIMESLSEYLYVNRTKEYLVPLITESLSNMLADGRGEKILTDVPLQEMNENRTVLHILSSNMEINREEQFNAVLKEEFENNEMIEWYTLELSSKRFSRDSSRLSYYSSLLRQDCVSRNVAAIIVSDVEALNFVKDYYYILFRNVPVLFYGVNQIDKVEMSKYEPYFTGIVENISAYETVLNALELFPDTKYLYVVNDYTKEGTNYQSIIENQLAPLTDRIQVEYNENLSNDELLSRIREMPEDGLVLFGSYFSDANGQYYSQNEMKRILKEFCKVPIFSFYSTDVVYHAVGGKCLDYKKYGEMVSELLKRILIGEDLKNMPIIYDSSEYNRWVFDKEALRKFEIDESALPEDSEILNETPSIWEVNPEFAVSLLTMFISAVLIIIGVNIFISKYHNQKERLRMANERLKNNEKIKEVKERLENIINTSPVAYALTVNGVVVETNDYMRRHVGVNQDDDMEDYYINISERKNLISKVTKQKQVLNEIIRFRMANGESHRFLANVMLIEYEKQKAFILWAMDIEESERKKDELSMARRSLQTVLDTLPVAVRIVDVDTARYLYANQSHMKMFGYQSFEKDGYGRHLIDFKPLNQPDGTNTMDKLYRFIHSTTPVSMEIQCKKADGTLFDTMITACLINYEGKAASLGIIKDLTAEKEYERRLIYAANKEKEANQLKSSFLVNMSHEIRTPMNAIIGLTEIELRKNLERDTREVYKKISNSAKSLLQIINDILDLSKIEADKMELMIEEFELEDVIESALLVVTPRLDEKNVELMLHSSHDLPRFVIGDKTRVWQILKNFLDNSAKYTEDGRIILSAFVNEEKSDLENVYITFMVEDTGVGMDEEQLRKLFVPYEQFYNEAQKKYKGTGLGMAISKRLCDIMGGELKIESKIGNGTMIRATIPFGRSQKEETQLQRMKSPHLSGKNILVVDDDERILEIVASLLSESEVNHVLACSGEEAVDRIASRQDGEESFDVVLLDYKVNGFKGPKMARQIKTYLPETPILLMATSYQKRLMALDQTGVEVDDVIEKPFVPSELIQRICEALGFEEGEERENQELTQFENGRVLLCEDNLINQEVAVGMLGEFGIIPTVAENGKQAIEILETDPSFDLILMDLQMPVMDGYQATRKIREQAKYNAVPIISLTADAMTEVVNQCLEAGMNDHLAKPIGFDNLHKVLLKWMPEDKRVA